MIWLNGSQIYQLLSSRCWRRRRMLVSLLGIYCLLTMFMVCGLENTRFGGAESVLTSTAAASHQYFCLAKQLLINHPPKHEGQLLAPLDQSDHQAETIDLLHRACAVAESHTNTMGIVLMSTLPVLACKYHSNLPCRRSGVGNFANLSRRSLVTR